MGAFQRSDKTLRHSCQNKNPHLHRPLEKKPFYTNKQNDFATPQEGKQNRYNVTLQMREQDQEDYKTFMSPAVQGKGRIPSPGVPFPNYRNYQACLPGSQVVSKAMTVLGTLVFLLSPKCLGNLIMQPNFFFLQLLIKITLISAASGQLPGRIKRRTSLSDQLSLLVLPPPSETINIALHLGGREAAFYFQLQWAFD